MKLYVRLEPPFEWVRVSGHSVEAFGEVSNATEYPLADDDHLIGVVPGEYVTVHKVSLPARTKRQFLSAVPYSLEDSVSEEVENLHFSCHEWRVDEEVVVYVVSVDKMRFWQTLANDSKLPLERLVPDYALLPLHDAAQSTICLAANVSEQSSQGVIVRHNDGSGAIFDVDFLGIWLSGLPLTEKVAVTDRAFIESLIEEYPGKDFCLWEVGNKLSHWLEQPETHTLDLLDDQFRPTVRKFDWRHFKLPAAMVAAAMLLVVVFDVYRYFSLHNEVRTVLSQQAEALQSAFPEIVDIPDNSARALMERAIENRVGTPEDHNATSLLAATAEIMLAQNVSLTEVGFREGKLSITCLLNDLSQADEITRGLNSLSGVSAQFESSATDDDQIVASYTLEAAS